MVGKMFAGLLGGSALSALAYLVLGLLDLPAMRTYLGPTPIGAVWAVALLVAIGARAASQAWRWMLLLTGLLTFVVPFVGVAGGGSLPDTELPGRIGQLLASVLGSDFLAARIGTEPAEIAHAWLVALNGQGFSLMCLGLGTLLLVGGLIVVEESPDTAPASTLPPDVLNLITAKRGMYAYRIHAHRELSEEEMILLVSEALEDGRLVEPEPGGPATLITRIGLDSDRS